MKELQDHSYSKQTVSTSKLENERKIEFSTYPDEFHDSIALGSQIFPSSSGIIVLKLQHIGNMRRVLNIEHPPKCTLLNSRKENDKHRIHHPKPQRPKKNPQSSPSKDLSNCMITQIHSGIHSEKCHRPRPEIHNPLVFYIEESDPFTSHQRKVDCEKGHVLSVTGRPAVGIARLEESAGLGASLLDGCLDEFVDELGDYEAESEADALEFTAENEVGDEAIEADENWD